jgi:hypothetical protein
MERFGLPSRAKKLFQPKFFSSRLQRNPRYSPGMFYFTIALVPMVAFAMTVAMFKPSEEELEQHIRDKFPLSEMDSIEAKNAGMAEHFSQVVYQAPPAPKGNKDGEPLKPGREGKKQLHAVDTVLKGTEKGAVEQIQVQGEMKRPKQQKKQRKRVKQQLEEAEPPNQAQNDKLPTPLLQLPEVTPYAVATVAAVATLAAVARYLGGRRAS